MNNKHWLFVFFTVLLLMLSSVFLLRQPILNYIINSTANKFKDKYGAELKVGDAGFMAFRDVCLNNISLVPNGSSDTILHVNSLKARISISKLMRFQIGFLELIVDTATVHLIKKDSTDNYSVFLKRKTNDNDTLEAKSVSGYNDRFFKLIKRANNILGTRISIRRLKIIYQKNDDIEMVSVPEFYFDGSDLKSSIVTSSLDGVNGWLVKGTTDVSNGKYDFSINRSHGSAFSLPFLDLIDGLKVSFENANVHFDTDAGNDPIPVKGHFVVQNLMVNHWRISPEDVIIPNFNFNLNATIFNDSITINNGTEINLNKLALVFTSSVQRNPEPRFRLDAGFDVANAQDFFNGIPQGMFNSFKGFQAKGELHYHLHFDLPRNNPDSLIFISELKKKNFQIIQYGADNFQRINAPFSFLAMDGDRPVRSFEVGPGNSSFTPLEMISPVFRDVVLTSEDPSFFTHTGFVEQSFRESIATNIKQGRFARGGSTISMQLVKNVFLSRNKTISRKLEEALIVWLIEQNRLLTKERMYEVYLNIIELGPNVYGVGEASRFYFNKTPAELTLSESIFLSSIIPHPKYFRYSFDASGNLKPFMTNYFKIVANRLVHREKISQAEADSLQPNVHLSGMALSIVIPADTIPVDSSLIEDLQLK